MTETKPLARFLTGLVCDDVRREENRKEILIGVYTGGILVEKFPARLALCLWLLLRIDGEGELVLDVRVVDSDDTELIAGKVIAEVTLTDEQSSLTFPKMPLKVEKPTSLRFQVRQAENDWQTVSEKTVRFHSIAGEASPTA